MDKKMMRIVNSDGSMLDVELITYLISDDGQFNYVVYSKGEVNSMNGDEVIYISRMARNGDTLYVEEITDETEWINVQTLLKKIANA